MYAKDITGCSILGDNVKIDEKIANTVHVVILIIQIAGPVLLVIFGMMDLLKAIIIASANDAAVAMAEYIAGDEENFVKLMNQKAKSLGMKDTNFLNACGLDEENHLTSANDIAIILSAIFSRICLIVLSTLTILRSPLT